MRELERDPSSAPCDPEAPSSRSLIRLAIVGGGRLGSALAPALQRTGYEVIGPLGRGADGAGVDAVLLCVPDSEIAAAAAAIGEGPLVGHCSGATSLDPLAPHERFSLHPLMTVTGAAPPSFAGAGAAIAGSTPHAARFATELAIAMRMNPVEVDETDRAAYHAAASIASNFLVTLEAAAERLGLTAGVERELLVPLVRATVENWACLGPERALTGPVARGDEATIALQRTAVAERTPELLDLFDALVEATRAVAVGPREVTLAPREVALG